MIVVDASSWVLALVDASPLGSNARDVLSADADWAAPAHTPSEVLRTLRRYEDRGLLTRAAADALAEEVVHAEVRYAGARADLLGYAWQHRHNLSPYDAPYVALAERGAVRLVTNDLRLARAAEGLGVAVTVPGLAEPAL